MPSATGRTAATPWWAAARSPVRLAVLLAAGPAVLSVLIGLLGERVGGDALTWRLVAVLVVMVGALVVVGRARAWHRTGSAGPASWRREGLVVIPMLIALAPLVTGIHLPAASTLVVLVAGYAATGVFEEIWHRGVIQDVLRGFGLRRAAAIGGALFALSHLANIAFGQSVGVSLAQAVGAFCFGVGFSILRWRTNAVWLLVAVHAVGDLLFKITDLHGGLLWGFLIAHDTAMLLWGLWCLRGVRDKLPVVGQPK